MSPLEDRGFSNYFFEIESGVETYLMGKISRERAYLFMKQF